MSSNAQLNASFTLSKWKSDMNTSTSTNTPLLIPLILNDLCYLKEPVNKNTQPGIQCKTCGKIFIGPKHCQRLLQHCDSLNHKYY